MLCLCLHHAEAGQQGPLPTSPPLLSSPCSSAAVQVWLPANRKLSWGWAASRCSWGVGGGGRGNDCGYGSHMHSPRSVHHWLDAVLVQHPGCFWGKVEQEMHSVLLLLWTNRLTDMRQLKLQHAVYILNWNETNQWTVHSYSWYITVYFWYKQTSQRLWGRHKRAKLLMTFFFFFFNLLVRNMLS